MKRQLLLCAPIALLFAACGSDSKTSETEKSNFSMDSVRVQINASNALYGSYFSKGDSTGFMDSYTSDACISPTGMPKMCGKEAITAFFNEGVKMGIKNIVLTTDELMGGKDGVIEVGKYDLQGEGGASWDKGKFIVIWKEENGKWKMHRDIWNSDAPPPTANK